MSQTTADLIHYFVKRVPGAGRTQVMKFLYLADLEARKYLGRPLSDLDYILWDYGPFDSQVLAQLDDLCARGFLSHETVDYASGKKGHRYGPTDKPLAAHFTEDERAVLDFVAAEYGSMTRQALVEEVVYQSAPMVDAKERGACLGERLRMEPVDGQEQMPGLELGQLLHSIEALDRGEGKSLREVLSRDNR
jgi:hypothetical protein